MTEIQAALLFDKMDALITGQNAILLKLDLANQLMQVSSMALLALSGVVIGCTVIMILAVVFK